MQTLTPSYLKLALIAVLSTVVAAVSGCDNKTADGTSQTKISTTAQPSSPSETNEDEVISQTGSSVDESVKANEPMPIIMPTAIPAQAVTPNGFGGLSFGQAITDELLDELGLVKDDEILNESCYYVHDPKLTYMDDELGERASVLYQIIDGVVQLISIQDPNIPFYTGVQIGDTPARIMSVHDDRVNYAVDKYATDGNYYQLIYNVNFDVTHPPKTGVVIKKENYQLNGTAKQYHQTTPLQIKYKLKDGQSLGLTDIAADAWTDDDKNKLTGTLYTIDIGEPEAIYLVEGCS